MLKNEFTQFAEYWQMVNDSMQFGKTFNVSMMEFVFEALEDYPLDAIKQAVKIHAKQNWNAPQPSDIISLLRTGNKRLSAHEALAEMPQSEDDTVVWTPEAQEAWGNASKLKSQYSRDKAFVETYERLCKESELLNRPITWNISLGESKSKQKQVLEAAYEKGRISKKTLQNYLPAPTNITIEGQALIPGKTESKNFHPEFKKKLSEMWQLIDDAEVEEKARLDAEQAAAEKLRREREDAATALLGKEDEAIALLPPDQQLALRNANLERYGSEVLH